MGETKMVQIDFFNNFFGATKIFKRFNDEFDNDQSNFRMKSITQLSDVIKTVKRFDDIILFDKKFEY